MPALGFDQIWDAVKALDADRLQRLRNLLEILLARGEKRPLLRTAEFQVKVRHLQPKAGIPRSARADAQQSTSCIGEDRSGVGEFHLHRLPLRQWLGEEHSDNIISASRQLGTGERFVLYEIKRLAITRNR